MTIEVTNKVPQTLLPGGWVVGGKTRLLDVWSPSNITYWSPPFEYQEHELTFTFGEEVSSPAPDRIGRKGKLAKLIKKDSAPQQLGDSTILFDARYDTSTNVAHVLQNQIGVALTALKAFGMENRYADLVFIVLDDTPAFAVRLFEVLGFKTIASTQDSFQGNRLKMRPNIFPIRAFAGEALREHAQLLGILDKTKQKEGSLFVSRRNRRGLSNLDEIESILSKQDFRTIYPEDLAIEDQIRSIAEAKLIFGIHGAGLGFQLFRNPQQHGVVIECFPSAFITNWARSMSMRGGDTWLGCQGELSTKVMQNVLSGANPHDLEGENFEVCAAAVSTTLRMANRALGEGFEANPHLLAEEISPIVVPANP